MSEQQTDRYTNSPLQKKEIHKSPAIKRITTLKGMGKFCKTTNKKLVINIIVDLLLPGEIWRTEKEEIYHNLGKPGK
jgi:type III secretory pathway component EscU